MGGMGTVYRVEHVRMGKVAAMKVLRRDLVDDAQAARRFIREVEVVSKLDHPNIVQTFDFGEWRGLLYLVMELVRGDDLAVIVKRDGPLPLSRALPLFSQVCQALDEAHHSGVIHRDLKPDNIVVFRRREGEHVKVLDFGLAKLRERPGMAEVTGTGSLVGTPYYMAPEQVRSEAVDERTDVYALGATIYRVVTGTPVFGGDSPMAILSRHITDPVEPPSLRRPGLPLGLDHLLIKAMAKDPANRFASATQMREAIEALLQEGQSANEQSQPIPSWVDSPRTRSTALSDTARSGITTAVTPVAFPHAEDSDPVTRLRRQDVDLFETAIRRRRKLFLAMAPVVALLGLALLWRMSRAPKELAGPTETEPNDSAQTADLASNATTMFGQIAPPGAEGTPDFDYYRVPVQRAGGTFFAAVSGIADLNLVLELYDSSGNLVSKADGGEEGSGESLGPMRIGPGDAFLRVRPRWHEGQRLPLPSSQTPYAVSVKWGSVDPNYELEPNDNQASASTLVREQFSTGHLSSAADMDWFTVLAPTGTRVVFAVQASEDLPVAIEIPLARQKIITMSEATTQPLTVPQHGRLFVVVKEASFGKSARLNRFTTYTIMARQVP